MTFPESTGNAGKPSHLFLHLEHVLFFMFHLTVSRAGTKREVAETSEVKFMFTHFRMYSIFIQANCILPLKPVERNRYLQAWFTGLI